MEHKEFISQRINIYAGKTIDPNSDQEIKDMLRSKFNIHLPQRNTLIESLNSTISDHEIIRLILQYRSN